MLQYNEIASKQDACSEDGKEFLFMACLPVPRFGVGRIIFTNF